jgi:hypothetical protein
MPPTTTTLGKIMCRRHLVLFYAPIIPPANFRAPNVPAVYERPKGAKRKQTCYVPFARISLFFICFILLSTLLSIYLSNLFGHT